jgi:hypothetical protein
MVKVYKDKGNKIKPAKIPPPVFTAIGRMVRAFAEIEDSLNIYIYNLARTPEPAAVILLGRSPISAKLTMAKALSSLHHTDAIATTEKLFFGQEFSEAKECRNAAAHGIFLGAWGRPKHYAFLTDKVLEAVNFNMRREVVSYDLKTFKYHAAFAERWASHISSELELQPLREKRFQQSLLPHRKGLKKAEKNKGPASQRGSSRP